MSPNQSKEETYSLVLSCKLCMLVLPSVEGSPELQIGIWPLFWFSDYPCLDDAVVLCYLAG